jgi:hypothetical protein
MSMDGDTPSQLFSGFTLSEPSARFFDVVAARHVRLRLLEAIPAPGVTDLRYEVVR